MSGPGHTVGGWDAARPDGSCLNEVGRNAPFKKLVTAALAGAKGPNAVAAIVDRLLAGLERARGFVDWEKRKSFAADLRATLATITDELGPADPAAAV
jgi:hypothetical protein